MHQIEQYLGGMRQRIDAVMTAKTRLQVDKAVKNLNQWLDRPW